MPSLDCTLLADGPSDMALIPIIEWLIRQHVEQTELHCEWADLRRLPTRPRTLADKITGSLELFPCHLLFIHRDAENQDPQLRYDEIAAAMGAMTEQELVIPHVCVVPVRMMESWLLLDEQAIRLAAGNPNGRTQLDLPSPRRIEQSPDCKNLLHMLLATASGLHGRRLKKFSAEGCARQVTQSTRSFEMLRLLPAFQRLETDVCSALARLETAGKCTRKRPRV